MPILASLLAERVSDMTISLHTIQRRMGIAIRAMPVPPMSTFKCEITGPAAFAE